MRSNWIGLVMVAIVATSCTASTDDPPSASPEPTPSEGEPAALIAALPNDCEPFGGVPRRGEVTFVSGRRLYASSPDGTEVRCIGRSKSGVLPSWGGTGDRFFLQAGIGAQVVFSENRYEFSPFGAHPFALGLSRPTGSSVLFVNNADTGLWKMDATGGSKQDISFLARHDEAIYHPAGEHIVVAGEDERGRYGIFVASNEGADPHLLVLGEDAKRVFSLTFAPDGSLYYVAEHDDRYDVHSVTMQGAGGGDIATGGLATYYSSKNPIFKVVVSQFGFGPLAVQVSDGDGSCPSQTVLWDEARGGSGNSKAGARADFQRRSTTPIEGDELAGRGTDPVGWLPNGDLVLTTVDGPRCKATGDVYTWNKRNGLTLLVGEASAVAIRGALPDPPDPPTKEPEVVA